MKSITFGTNSYEIPLEKGYQLKWGYPLRFIQNWDDSWIIECPAFDEYGYGKSAAEAMADLGSSIVDLWLSIHHNRQLKKRRKNLGESLRRILIEFERSMERIE